MDYCDAVMTELKRDPAMRETLKKDLAGILTAHVRAGVAGSDVNALIGYAGLAESIIRNLEDLGWHGVKE